MSTLSRTDLDEYPNPTLKSYAVCINSAQMKRVCIAVWLLTPKLQKKTRSRINWGDAQFSHWVPSKSSATAHFTTPPGLHCLVPVISARGTLEKENSLIFFKKYQHGTHKYIIGFHHFETKYCTNKNDGNLSIIAFNRCILLGIQDFLQAHPGEVRPASLNYWFLFNSPSSAVTDTGSNI